MKQVITTYNFNASVKTITLPDFSGSHPVDLKRLYLITDVTTNKVLYNFADSTVASATISTNNVISLSTLQGGESNGDSLQIIYDVTPSDPNYQIPLLPSNAVQESGGNLAAVATSTANLPSQGGALTTHSLPVNIASDQTVPVSTISLPLPTGAATSTNQSTANTSLSSIATSSSTLAGAISASKMNVTIASGSVATTQSGTWIVQPGNTPNTTPWLVGDTPVTSGGLSVSRTLDVQPTATTVKSSAGQVYGWFMANNASSVRYVKFYTANAPSNENFASGIAFATAISIRGTTGVADTDTGAPTTNDIIANIFYA
jgi:hypothetical protein